MKKQLQASSCFYSLDVFIPGWAVFAVLVNEECQCSQLIISAFLSPFFVVQQQSIVMLVWQDVYFDFRLRKGLSADVLASISLFDPNRKPVHFWPKMSLFSPS
jgi:hypothetical protein